MPNQLARSKKRKTVAEHAAVLEMLELVAEKESKTSTELLREAARTIIREHAQKGDDAAGLFKAFRAFSPKLPAHIHKPRDLARFKKECREYDNLALDLGLKQVTDVQESNSIHRESAPPVLMGHL